MNHFIKKFANFTYTNHVKMYAGSDPDNLHKFISTIFYHFIIVELYVEIVSHRMIEGTGGISGR
jgi:hypothetical protein